MSGTAFRVVQVLTAIVLVVICLGPVAYGYAALVEHPESIGTAFTSGALVRLVRSVACAALIATAATVIGVPLGLSWSSRRGKLGGCTVALCLMPLLLPPYVYALAWIEVVGALFSGADGGAPPVSLYSVAGVVVLECFRLTPVVAGATWLAVRLTDPALIHASLLCRGRLATIRSVLLPLQRSVLLAGTLVVLLLAMTNYSTAALLQVPLYPVDIQTRFSAEYDSAGAFALTVPLPLLGFLALAAWNSARRLNNASFARTEAPVDLVARSTAAAFTGVFLVMALVAPLGVVVARTGSFRALREAAIGLSDEIAASIGIAGATAASALLLAVALAACFRRAQLLLMASAIPLLITGPAFGIGAVLMWNHEGWRGAVYDSPAILVIVETARVLVIGLLGAWLGMMSYDRDLDHAAELAQQPGWSRFLHISVPLGSPVLVSAAAMMVLLVFGDAAAAAIVTPPGITPLAVRIAGLLHYGPSDFIHAASLLSAAVVAAVLVIAVHRMRRLVDRTT